MVSIVVLVAFTLLATLCSFRYWVVAGINIYPSDLESLGVNREITDSIVDACIM